MKPERIRRLDRFASTRMVLGLWIIIIGAVFLAGNLGLIETRSVLRHLWPLLMIFIGSALVMEPSQPRRQRWGWVLIGVGSWIFLDRIGWVDLNLWQVFFPGLLLFVGGMLVWRALAAPHPELQHTAEEHAEFVRSFAVISSSELRPVSRPFRGADLSAVMAGIKLDLTDARMEGDSATIEVFAFWGGMEICVPPDWTVTSKVTTLMGGFIDKRRPTTVLPTKTLIITGFIVMGGIEVKN